MIRSRRLLDGFTDSRRRRLRSRHRAGPSANLLSTTALIAATFASRLSFPRISSCRHRILFDRSSAPPRLARSLARTTLTTSGGWSARADARFAPFGVRDARSTSPTRRGGTPDGGFRSPRVGSAYRHRRVATPREFSGESPPGESPPSSAAPPPSAASVPPASPPSSSAAPGSGVGPFAGLGSSFDPTTARFPPAKACTTIPAGLTANA